jgi:M6 family metalloprotease-like protein
MKLKNIVLALCLLAVAAVSFAMPPREGIQEPEALKAMRLKGMDSPARGLIQQLRSKDANAKISGSRKYPVVMGYFTDLAATNTQAEFQAMLFSNATGTKSVNNFYRDMSYNAMSCSGVVDNWRTSNNTVAYYTNGTTYGMNGGTTANTYEFIRKVLVHADSFVNFADSSYDQNKDGYVDVLWVTHAGKGAEEGAANIWSHSFYLSGFGGGATYYTTNDISPFTGSPVRINEYIINPERTNYADGNNTTTEMIGAGVYCHEFGHALGLPDLYDTGDSGPGIGNWSVMAGGSWGANGNTGARPSALDVWSRRFLGWASPIRVTNDNLYTVNSIMTTAAGSSYKLAKLGADTTRQFWLIENRYKNAMGPVSTVKWDSLLYGQGLSIYHIDSTYTTTTELNANTVNASNTRAYGVALEETDQTTAGYSSELYNGINSGDAADVWNSTTQTSFDSVGTAYPVTYLNGTTATTGGAHTMTAIRAIPAASAAMACSMFVAVPTGVEGQPQAGPMPEAFVLSNSYPNPGKGQITFSYQLPKAGRATLEIYNMLGQTVQKFDLGFKSAGTHNLNWNTSQQSQGVYFYRLQAGDFSSTKKLVVVK